MPLRTILNALAATLLVASASVAGAQDAPAKRLASIAGVAVEEYTKGVDDQGRIFAQLEYDEAVTFLGDARELIARINDGREDSLATLIDSMRAVVGRQAAPAELVALHARLVGVLGPDAALDYPRSAVSLAEGKAIYETRCASCHGETGNGDGPAAAGMVPAPPAFADHALMADVTPALMYRIVSVGIQGTAMTNFSDLTPEQRWAVVTYVNTLRHDGDEAARGLALLARRCTRCDDGATPDGHTFPWLAERHDQQVLAALASGDALLGMEAQPPLNERDARAILAGLRMQPTVVAPARRAPTAVAADVLRILDESIARARAGELVAAGDLAFDSYVAFEPLESNVRTRDPGLVGIVERHFADFKGAVKANDVTAATRARARIAAALPQVVEFAESPATGWGAFLESLLIIVREGFEAILIIGAVVAFLIKTGNAGRLREIWVGVGAGLLASAALAIVLRTMLANAPASREVIEGVTMLVAVGVLFSVSYWLLSKVESAKWQRFIRDKVGAAVTSGKAHALALVAFLAVFREGAETALFYQALFARGPEVHTPAFAGMGAGALVLAVIWVAFHRFGVRLPLRAFFATTSGLLYYLAFVFMGKGLRELQEGNLLQITALEHGPYVEWLGMYPSVETLIGQGILILLALYALWRSLWGRGEPAAAPASAAATKPAAAATLPLAVEAEAEGRG
jgi:high-affinity iron transporter